MAYLILVFFTKGETTKVDNAKPIENHLIKHYENIQNMNTQNSAPSVLDKAEKVKTSGTGNQKQRKKPFNSKKPRPGQSSTSSTMMKRRSDLGIGDIINVQITALGSKNIGISEFSNGLTILVPNSQLGDKVQVEIQKMFFASSSVQSSSRDTFTKINTNIAKNSGPSKKYAIGKIVSSSKKESSPISKAMPFKVGEELTVTISKLGPQNSGLANISEDLTVIVPALNSFNAPMKVGDQLKVKITKFKRQYAFAKVVTKDESSNGSAVSSATSSVVTNSLSKNALMLGQKMNLILPKTAKSFSTYFVIQLNGQFVFIKKSLGVKLGDHVRIQITKNGSNFAVAQFLKRNPLSKTEKFFLAKMNAKQMIEAGMHYGEKAIRCNANMRQYIWLRKKGKHQNRPLLKRGRHIINVLKTRRCFNQALKQLAKYAAKGKTFLFVGTKKPAAALIARTALLSQTSFFVNTRWLGGMLTNWKTILKSIAQIRPILKEKQRMIQKILEKRQKIKRRLLKKVNLLRKKSQKLLFKGKDLIAQIGQNQTSFMKESQKLMQQKSMLLAKNQFFIQKYSELMLKQQKMNQQIGLLEQKGNAWIKQKQILKAQILENQTKLQEFRQLFMIGTELMNVQKATQQNGQTVVTVSYGTFTKMSGLLGSSEKGANGNEENWMIPNPSNVILNKIIGAMQLSFSDLSTEANTAFNRAKSETVLSDSNTIVLSKLLNQLTLFLPFIKKYMQILVLRLQNQQSMLTEFNQNIQQIREKLNESQNLAKQIRSELAFMEEKMKNQQTQLTLLQTKLKQLASEQRLLKFLPKLRYLPTSKQKMYETVELLMKKFVDPKLIYPMEQIYDQKFKFTSKKMAATRKQKWQRLEKYFGGVTKMAKMKKSQISNNVAIIVGQQEEMNAVRECQKLGIKMFTIVDTNCNPKFSDHIIPANDDSRNSVKYVLEKMLIYIRLAQKLRAKVLSRRMKRASLRQA